MTEFSPLYHDDLVLRSLLLWPGNIYLQCEWLRAIEVVRNTRNGWLLDWVPPEASRRVCGKVLQFTLKENAS